MYSLFGVSVTCPRARAVFVKAQNGQQQQEQPSGVRRKSRNPSKQGNHKGLPPADDVGRSPWLPAPSQIAEELRPRHQRRTRHVPSQHPRVEEQKHAGQRQQQADQSLPERAPQRSRTPAKQEQQQQGGLQQPDAPPAQPPIKRPQHRQAEGAKHRANSQQPSSHQPAQIKGRPSPATQPTPLLQPQPQARHHHPATQHSGPWQSADAHRQQARSSARTPPTPPPSSLSPTARVSPLHGRYLPQVPQTPAAALRLAADLAQLAGPDVGIRGPHIRGREQPVEARQAALRLTAVAGQSQDPWWQWKQWVQQRARRAAVVARLARSRGKLRAGGKAGTGGSLSVMLMDDWALDLDELEEGVTADALHGPQQDMVGQVAHDTWRQLRQLAAQMPAPNKQQRQQSKGAPSRRLQQGQGSRDQQGAAQGEKRDTGQGRAPKLETVPYLSIYKGGGYVAADLEFMLTRMGLSQVLRLHMHMQGAHCILAKQKWRSGRPVDLRQQEAAARRRGIPLLLVPSLSMRDVLTALRPLLLERGVLPDSSAKRQMIIMRRGDNDAQNFSAPSAQPLDTVSVPNSTPCSSTITGASAQHQHARPSMPLQQLCHLQQQVIDGILPVHKFIQAVQLQGHEWHGDRDLTAVSP